jgi:hypothetical protein
VKEMIVVIFTINGWNDRMPIPRQCEYVNPETNNYCHRLAVKKYGNKWLCEDHKERGR